MKQDRVGPERLHDGRGRKRSADERAERIEAPGRPEGCECRSESTPRSPWITTAATTAPARTTACVPRGEGEAERYREDELSAESRPARGPGRCEHEEQEAG